MTIHTLQRLLLIAALALLPVIPYALLGYAGQDLPFHVCSWLDMREGWLHGRVNPGWSAASNFGLGDPHLTLYPPISYLVGAFLTLVLPLRLTPAVFAYLALVLSGLSMYVASGPFVRHKERLSAALLYMLSPYTITTSLVRFAAAELLVQAWLPLIALCFYRAVWLAQAEISPRRRAQAFIQLALLLGLSWITNIPASIMVAYSLAIAAAVSATKRRSSRPLLYILTAEAGAAGIAAFHLVPIWAERSWIHTDTLLRTNPLQLLLLMPHHDVTDGPLLIVCWIFLCAECLLVSACLYRRISPLASDPAVPFWVCLAATSFFFQTPLSIWLWLHGPQLRFIQFPMRFLSILGVALPLILLSRGTRLLMRGPAYTLLACLSMLPFLGYFSEQAVAGNRAPPLHTLLASWQRRGAPEYLPAGTLMPLGPSGSPAVSVVDQSTLLGATPDCRAELQEQTGSLHRIRTASTNPCRIRLRLYFYPYWCATDESGQQLPTSKDSSGLLVVEAPPGVHTIVTDFRPASTLRSVSRIASLVTFLFAICGLIYVQTRPACWAQSPTLPGLS